MVGNSRVAPMKQLYIRQVVPSAQHVGVGPLGIGDHKYGLSVGLLNETVNTTPGFVKNFHYQWVSRAGGTVVSYSEKFQTPMKLSCFEEFGFCWREVGAPNRDIFFRTEKHLLRFIQEFRKKFIHNKKNTGPHADIKHPLLIASKGILCQRFGYLVFVFFFKKNPMVDCLTLMII